MRWSDIQFDPPLKAAGNLPDPGCFSSEAGPCGRLSSDRDDWSLRWLLPFLP